MKTADDVRPTDLVDPYGLDLMVEVTEDDLAGPTGRARTWSSVGAGDWFKPDDP